MTPKLKREGPVHRSCSATKTCRPSPPVVLLLDQAAVVRCGRQGFAMPQVAAQHHLAPRLLPVRQHRQAAENVAASSGDRSLQRCAACSSCGR